MGENEMVKEMTEIINNRCDAELGQVHATKMVGDCQVTQTTDTKLIAKALYNADYRKIPDGAVVLNIGKNNEALDEKTIEFFVKHNAKVRKETAREILNDLKGLLEGYVHTKENISLYEQYCQKYGVYVE